ncbi:MAG TPA: hypothetical protein VK358_14160, partial [Longimicrobium sp.]|nr:hypothetical protein [Longimicrobium sp.]
MRIDSAAVWARLQKAVAHPDPPDVAAVMAEIIDICESGLPHADWAAVRALDYAGAADAVGKWFRCTLHTELPAAPTRGLCVALVNPVHTPGEATLDLEMFGTAEFDGADPGLHWLFSRCYSPDAYAECAVLDQLYGIAYGTHSFAELIEGTLGNECEWPVGLAFAVLATRRILAEFNVGDLPGAAPPAGVAAGWA